MNAEALELIPNICFLIGWNYCSRHTEVGIYDTGLQPTSSIDQESPGLRNYASITHFGLNKDWLQKVLRIYLRFKVRLFYPHEPQQALDNIRFIKLRFIQLVGGRDLLFLFNREIGKVGHAANSITIKVALTFIRKEQGLDLPVFQHTILSMFGARKV